MVSLRKDSVIRLSDILKISVQYQTRRELPLLVDAGAFPPPVFFDSLMARLH